MNQSIFSLKTLPQHCRSLAERGRAQFAQAGGQAIRRQVLARDRPGPDAERVNAPAPEGLVGEVRDDQRRLTSAQAGGRGTGAAVLGADTG